MPDLPQDRLDDAILAFTLGETEDAAARLQTLTAEHPDWPAAWLALAEVHFARRDWDNALAAAEQAVRGSPEDIHVHTTLSRIWMERGDKAKAEHHGAQARMLAWQEELRTPSSPAQPLP